MQENLGSGCMELMPLEGGVGILSLVYHIPIAYSKWRINWSEAGRRLPVAGHRF